MNFSGMNNLPVVGSLARGRAARCEAVRQCTFKSLCFALLGWWRGWRPVALDPPPLDLPVLGLCSYTGVRSVTARVEFDGILSWKYWYHSYPTHWRHLPHALPLTPRPPVREMTFAPQRDSSDAERAQA